MRNLLSAILLSAAAALFAGDPAAPSFVGDWEFVAVRNGKEDKSWPRTVMTVSADGSCVTRAPRGADFEVVRGKWRQKGNDVCITDSDGEHRARFDEMCRLKLVTDGKEQEFLRGYEFFLRRAKKTSAHLAAGAPYAAGAMFEALGIPKDQVREAWHTPELKLRAAQWRDTKLKFESGNIGIYEVWDRELAALRALMGQPEVAVSPLMPELRSAYLERLRRQLDMLKAEHRAGFIGTDPIREKELEISEFRKRHELSETPPSEWIRSAFAQYRAAAEKGDAAAQFELGCRLGFGWGVEGDNRPEAAKWFEKAAVQGHPTARGACLMFGFGVGKDLEQAEKLFRAEAKKGDAWARLLLGMCRLEKRDVREAVRWFRKAALQGNAVAQFHLSERYHFGDGGVAKDPAEAEKWMKKSAEQGFEPALRVLEAWKLWKRPSKVVIRKADGGWICPSNTFRLDEKQLKGNGVDGIRGDAKSAKRLYFYYNFLTKDQYKAFAWLFIGAKLGDEVCEHNFKFFCDEKKIAEDRLFVLTKEREKEFSARDDVFYLYCLYMHYKQSGEHRKAGTYLERLKKTDISPLLLK